MNNWIIDYQSPKIAKNPTTTSTTSIKINCWWMSPSFLSLHPMQLQCNSPHRHDKSSITTTIIMNITNRSRTPNSHRKYPKNYPKVEVEFRTLGPKVGHLDAASDASDAGDASFLTTGRGGGQRSLLPFFPRKVGILPHFWIFTPPPGRVQWTLNSTNCGVAIALIFFSDFFWFFPIFGG